MNLRGFQFPITFLFNKCNGKMKINHIFRPGERGAMILKV